MSEYIKLFDGLIVKRPDIDPEKEFRYADPAEYEVQILDEIATLQKTVSGFTCGEFPEQAIEIDEKMADAVKVICQKHNDQIGYTGACKELEEKQAILNCLRGENVL